MTDRLPHDQLRPDQLRLSDAERDEATRLLGEHYAAGRLTADEHEERTTAAFAARTRGELPPLFADLPGGSPWSQPRVAPPQARGYAPTRGDWSPRRTPVPPVLRLLGALLLLVLVLAQLPWLLVGLVVFLVISRRVGHRSGACRAPARAVYR